MCDSMNIHDPFLLNFIKKVVSILYCNLYILTNISKYKEFRSISDQIIALIIMSKKNEFLSLGYAETNIFFQKSNKAILLNQYSTTEVKI